MNRSVAFLLSILFLASCAGETNEQEVELAVEPEAQLVTLKDHILFLVNLSSGDKSLLGSSFEEVKSTFELSEYQDQIQDSISLENCVLKRTFSFENDQLISIKYATYTDSVGMVNSAQDMTEINSELSSLLGEPDHNTLNSSRWTTNGCVLKYKEYPYEGIDIILSPVYVSNQTNCVGDWQNAKSRLVETTVAAIQQKIRYDSLLNEKFDGFMLSFEDQEATLLYTCDISEKLVLVDQKSLIDDLNKSFGAKPEVKDDMYFWDKSGSQIQLIILENGYSIKFIN